MKTHIQTLADAGAHFVLCKADKRPVEKWKEKRPTAARAREWLKDKGNLLSVVPGSLGLLVVDIDKDVERARSLVVGSSSPLAEADTRKGKHLYYPKTKSRTGNRSWQYGDIRQDAGYVVVWNIDAVVTALKNLPGEPFDLDVLPRSASRTVEGEDDAEDKGGRNNRLWGETSAPDLSATERRAPERSNGQGWLVYRTRKLRPLLKRAGLPG